jgi:hypothetical protein
MDTGVQIPMHTDTDVQIPAHMDTGVQIPLHTGYRSADTPAGVQIVKPKHTHFVRPGFSHAMKSSSHEAAGASM